MILDPVASAPADGRARRGGKPTQALVLCQPEWGPTSPVFMSPGGLEPVAETRVRGIDSAALFPPAHLIGVTLLQASLWNRCLRLLESEIPEQQFNTWVRPLQAIEENGTLRLLAPNRFVIDWLTTNLRTRIVELIDAVA